MTLPATEPATSAASAIARRATGSCARAARKTLRRVGPGPLGIELAGARQDARPGRDRLRRRRQTERAVRPPSVGHRPAMPADRAGDPDRGLQDAALVPDTGAEAGPDDEHGGDPRTDGAAEHRLARVAA